jgi:hypothetical protein
MRATLLCVLAGSLASSGGAVAGDEARSGPAAAARKVRAALPAPAEGLGFEFEGDLVLAGEVVGAVKYAVDWGEYREKPVWLVTETRNDFGGAGRTVETSLYLSQDLSLLRGEIERKSGETTVRYSFVRATDGFDVVREVHTEKGLQPTLKVHAKAPEDATYGRAAVLLFLRGAPKPAATYSLPVFAPDVAAAGGATEHDTAAALLDVQIEAKGPTTHGGKPAPVDAWMATYRSQRGAYDVYLKSAGRSLLAISGVAPEPDVVPKGTAPKKAETEDDKPATTWKAAFMKFGHGYHMAIEKYLDAAFHWPTFHAHEKEIGDWKTAPGLAHDADLEQFKAQWIGAFLSQSLRRPRADADMLLHGTLQTGRVTTKGDDSVVFAAHAEYGGGVQRTYHLKRIDGVWYIVRIVM